jgi:hypothetical protein
MMLNSNEVKSFISLLDPAESAQTILDPVYPAGRGDVCAVVKRLSDTRFNFDKVYVVCVLDRGLIRCEELGGPSVPGYRATISGVELVGNNVSVDVACQYVETGQSWTSTLTSPIKSPDLVTKDVEVIPPIITPYTEQCREVGIDLPLSEDLILDVYQPKAIYEASVFTGAGHFHGIQYDDYSLENPATLAELLASWRTGWRPDLTDLDKDTWIAISDLCIAIPGTYFAGTFMIPFLVRSAVVYRIIDWDPSPACEPLRLLKALRA